jgi:hypothetical protein
MATPHPPPDPIRGYETRDVNLRAVLALAIATAMGAVLVQVGLYYLLAGYEAQARRNDTELSPRTQQQSTTLQSTPLADYERYRREQDRLTTTYGWVDRQQGIVRIPIERAMELYLERGPPEPAFSTVEQPPASEAQP